MNELNDFLHGGIDLILKKKGVSIYLLSPITIYLRIILNHYERRTKTVSKVD